MLPTNLMAEIASDEVIDLAYLWLCDRRKGYSHNNDVWSLRWCWCEIKPWVQQALLKGSYSFGALERVGNGRERREIWASLDALVLKAIAIVLSRHLVPLMPKTCHHLAGNGGAKAGRRRPCGGWPRGYLATPSFFAPMSRATTPASTMKSSSTSSGSALPTTGCSICFGNTCGEPFTMEGTSAIAYRRRASSALLSKQ
jgi:hypothetical protein